MVRDEAAALRWAMLAVWLQEGTRAEWALAMKAMHDWTLVCKPLEWVEAGTQR
jgi:hypothetical protein